jgi:iron complex outermembrane recepter protein
MSNRYFSACANPARKALFLIISTTFSGGFSTVFAAEDSDHHTHADIELAPVSVTANPLDASNDALITPVTVLNGRELSLRRESTLGDTLNGMPGVSATRFGPNASRPVIRGLDGERVKIMQNGVGILDASSLSFDHAVGVDPLVIEQIDVVRGPAALLYGGNATGGVVNAIDFRVPQEQIKGVSGRAEARFGGADNTRNGAVVVDVGNGSFAIHADAYGRETNDLDTPNFATSKRKNLADGTARENRGKLLNSDASGNGGALGAALTFDNGYAGLSYSMLDYNYGTVADEAVRIDMQSRRWDIASEFKNLNHAINRVKFRLAHTDYQHVELEGGEIGTTFNNRGLEGTFEAGHAPIAGLNGVVGVQFSNTNFAALGDEAFVPSVNTQNKAVYFYEELPIASSYANPHKISFGARLGQTDVDSKTNANFGLGQNNRFNPNSVALGGLYQFNQQWSLASNLSHNERAPSYFELYANGAHIATGQFEVGNTNFSKEKSNGLDAQLRWRDAKNSLNLGAFYTRFSNFIALQNTGSIEPISSLPIAQFSQVPAVFKGLEFDAKIGLNDNFTATIRGDYVHATNKRTNDYLPRIAPLRLGAGLQYKLNNFSARLDALHAFKQNKTAAEELKTNSYTDVSAVLAYKLPVKYNLELFAKASNLLNDEIRDHASFLKEFSPAGERSILFGLRGDF